jgi:hypothetical protein
MRARIYYLDRHDLTDMLRAGEKPPQMITVTEARNIPEGAIVTGFHADFMRNVVSLRVEHESFDDVPDGQCPPTEYHLDMSNRLFCVVADKYAVDWQSLSTQDLLAWKHAIAEQLYDRTKP